MTKIKNILSIPLNEDLKGVIDLNQQDEASIIEELEGFILTESLARHLADFCDFYVSGTSQPGLWLSGFYGSGKSYLSKMIGFLLKNPILVGTAFRDRFITKLTGLPNADLLQNSINELGRTQNHIVLFDAAKTTGNHGISYMMMAAFLRSLDLNDDWVGIVEYNLLMSGRYESFCQKVQLRYSQPWTARRRNMDQVYDTLEETMTEGGFCTQSAYDDMREAARQRILDYDAVKLHDDLERYSQCHANQRIVFMIDEVSEAILQDKINILDLEGMAESLASMGRKVWTVAIAQLQLDDVISAKNVNRNLLTKIIDRFRKRMPISAEEVDTIIRRRLLAKTTDGEKLLQEYFMKNSGMISDISNIVGAGLKKTSDAYTYADYYPFYEHQFKMLQYFLFGTQKLVKTQVGTRGMLISAFDVLKKEALSDRDLYAHVNAAQLCRQAEEAVPEALRARYNQADEHLADTSLQYVVGHDLLQTIHFLTEAGAKTTFENISRAYVNCPDDYFKVLSEVKIACMKLADEDILILSGDEYRITSETQLRIIEMMNKYEGIALYQIKREVTKQVKAMPLTRQAQSLQQGVLNVAFHVADNNGESFSTSGDQPLKVVLHDILSVKPSLSEYVNQVKQDTQSTKNLVSVVPSPAYSQDIQKVCEAILRIQYISTVPNLTDDEKNVVRDITNTLGDKMNQLELLVRKSFYEGTAIYLYNTYTLSEQNAQQTLRDIESKIYGNIFYKRLDGTLSDALASKILNASSSQVQSVIGQQQPDFIFFDTSGQFIGEQLPVVTEIMEQLSAYKNGSDLERDLAAAPTGYSFGTVLSTMAALFRASKIIFKYNNQEFHSYQQDGAKEVFQSARNFQKASFKAVARSLTYNEKRDLVDSLKDCNFKQLTGQNLSYNMNDFELVDAIRTLALLEVSNVNKQIAGDDDKERLFHRSLLARDVLQPYAATVTEGNYFQTAKRFLNRYDNEEFCSAVEKIEKDLKFIKSNLPIIANQQDFLKDVKAELIYVNMPTQQFDTILQNYTQLLESDPVRNFSQIQGEFQKARDLYYQYMKQHIQEMTEQYSELSAQLDTLRQKVLQYPETWNRSLLDKINHKFETCRRNVVNQIKLEDYEVRCCKCGMQLRDVIGAIGMIPQTKVEIEVMKTEIHDTDPTPAPQPTPSPGAAPAPTPQPTPQPKERKLAGQLPKGSLTVNQYKQWLMQQLQMVNQFGSTDILKFDE